MRQILGALLLVALAAHSVHAECTGKTSAEAYVGDVSLADYAVEFGSSGFVRIPDVRLGSSYHSFEMDVFTTTGDGCLFSFGNANTANYFEARLQGRAIKFRIGTQTEATSLAVVDLNIWQHLSIHFNNSGAGKVEIFVDNLRVVPDAQAAGVVDTVGRMNLANRNGFLGKCSASSSVSAIDNFFITDNYRTVDDIETTLRQFFPVIRENSLIAYFGFNEADGHAKASAGASASNFVEGILQGTAQRKARVALDTDGLMNTDKVCTHNGATVVLKEGTESTQNAPYFRINGGGFTNTLDCSADDTPAFAVNQRWDSNGAVIGVSIFSHLQHRWRVTPGPALVVERADWGGWLQVAESVGVIEEDGSTYIVGRDVFQLQVANVGWIRVSLESSTSLSYQYAFNSKACATAETRDACAFKTTDREKFMFSNIPMSEPMGLAPTTAGVGNLPATLACPTPTFGGYPYYGDTGSFCDRYQPAYESRCCSIAGKYYKWCPPKYEQCWSYPLGNIRSGATWGTNAQDRAYCCANYKYENGNTAGNRLPWCEITYNDCQTGPFDSRCCAESLRVNVVTRRTLPQCEVTNYDCWTMNVDDSRCCAWSWPASDALGEGSGLRYRSGRRHRSCPLIYNDCHRLPGSRFQDPGCCQSFKYSTSKWRLEYCEPTREDCWKWFIDSSYPMQQDGKCCVKPAPGSNQVDRRFWTNAQGQVIALPFCDLDNKDCWTTGVIDDRCCSSDDRKYFLNPDGTQDFTRRLAQCTPTVDDCWGWDTNPTKFPRKVEDQRCCEARATRYHPVTGKRLDYCYPNFDDCWGYHLSGNLRDDDQRCCDRYPEAKGERLPYCAPSQPVPPPPPVAPPPPPVLSVDVCSALKTEDANKYDDIVSTCEKLWGPQSTQNVARLTCIATMCKNDDPDTPPVPDCRVERLLQAANPAHVLPPACTSGCPNGCYGRGDCNNRKCTCKPGWSGADCSTPTNYNKCEFTPMAGSWAQCTPFPVTYQNLGVTQLLTHDFSNITVQYYDMAKKMRDTTMIYMVKTIDSFTARNERFHLFVTNNDGTGTASGSYTMTLTFSGNPDLSQMSWANLGGGLNARVTSIDNTAKTVTITANWQKTQFNAVVLFNVTTGIAPQFTVRMNQLPAQVVMACMSSTGATDINRLTSAQLTGAGVGVQCARLATVCDATDCKSCAALANCGWCVETGSCVPGDATGPFVGQCFNWRFTFDSTMNRRLTIIPGYPTNPRLTDVFLRQAAGGNELPIEIGVTAFDPTAVPWDLVMFNEYTARTASAFYPNGISRILGALTEFPNSGVGLANLRTDADGFNFVKLITNPRDVSGIPASLANLDAGILTPESGNVDALGALYRAADPAVNHFNLRPAARSIFLITSTRAFVDRLSDASFMAELRQRLLDRNVALVCAVPDSLAAEYTRLVRALGFGRVIKTADDLSNIVSVVPTSLVRAASSIGLSLGQETGHVNTASFATREESYTVDNLRPPMRAKFWVPVYKVATGGRYTQLYFPTYGRSTIETVPTDAPVGLTEPTFTGKSDQATLIELKGRSFRNLFAVSFNITSLPDPAKGNLFLAKMDENGEWVKTSETLPHSGELLTTDLPVIVPFGRVMYQPKDINADGDAYDTFGYKVIDGCTESTQYTVTMNIFRANRPPVAEMPGPRGREGQPMLVTLGASNPDGATIQFVLTRDLYDVTEGADRTTFPIGKFCAYDNTFGTPAFNRDCAPITAGTVLPNNEMVYVPPFYGHSFADPTIRPELLIIPCFGYKVTYTFPNAVPVASGDSNELDVQIILDHVNQAPYAWGDLQAEVRDNVFKFDWNTVETPLRGANSGDLVCIPKVGGADCVYEEDFGQRYWWDAGFRYISLGGYDIESSDLTIEITSLNLPDGALLMAWYDDSKNIQVGDIIPNLKSGTLNQVLKFRPEKEMHSRPTDNDVYATFSYRVRDKEGAVSPRAATVSIKVIAVDKPPRMSRQVLDVTVYEGRAKEFPIDAEDPENQPFDSYLVGCTSKKGTLFVCLDASKRCDPISNPSNAREIDCKNIPAGGIKLPKTQNAAGGVDFVGMFKAPKLNSVSEGQKYETVFFEFRDGSVARFAPYKFVVNFNVIKINQAPEILIADADGVETSAEKYTASLSMGTAWSSKIRVVDSDIGFGILDMNVTLDDTYAGSAQFDLAALGNGGALQGLRVQQKKRIQFRGAIAAANKLLQRLTANLDPNLFPDSGSATAKIVISVSDNGYTGQCPDSTQFEVRTCAQMDSVEITVQWAKPGDNNQVTVAASASAAAFAGVAAVAAALLFRKFNSKAENGYAPWQVDDNDEGIVSNPLYENNGLSGENPLFEAEGQNDKL